MKFTFKMDDQMFYDSDGKLFSFDAEISLTGERYYDRHMQGYTWDYEVVKIESCIVYDYRNDIEFDLFSIEHTDVAKFKEFSDYLSKQIAHCESDIYDALCEADQA
jgi:predicted sulfurtransferase